MPVWLTGNLIKGLAVLALLAALMFGANQFVQREREAGANECRAAVARATAEASVRVRAVETEGQIRLDKISRDLQKTKEALNVEKDRNVAAARDGSLKLRDQHGTCSSGGAEAPANTSGDSKAAGCELSAEAAAFLLNEAARADEIVLQLKAAQELLASDRKLINGRD